MDDVSGTKCAVHVTAPTASSLPFYQVGGWLQAAAYCLLVILSRARGVAEEGLLLSLRRRVVDNISRLPHHRPRTAQLSGSVSSALLDRLPR